VRRFIRGEAVHGAEEPVSADEARNALDYAVEGLGRIEQLIADLGSMAQQRENVRFEIGQVVALAARMARTKTPIQIRKATDSLVQGNPAQIAQALVALLANADQATARAEEPRITVQTNFAAGRTLLSIDDNGDGIPAENLALVFEPFFSTRGRDGLGLVAAREVIEHHGGQVVIKSTAGKGTSVLITLPGEPMEDDLEIAGLSEA
jgi:signal transduction histidine kinase